MTDMNEEYDIGQSATLADFLSCVNHYRMYTPGLYVCVSVPVQLNKTTRLTPGFVAQVNSGKFKQCDPGDYQYFSGPPNFVFDVFKDNQRQEYEKRKALFERSRVIEYVVWFASDKMPIWNRLHKGAYLEISEDEEGLIKSSALPGMWFPIDALAERDWRTIMAKISWGITRRGHRDFMKTIWRS